MFCLGRIWSSKPLGPTPPDCPKCQAESVCITEMLISTNEALSDLKPHPFILHFHAKHAARSLILKNIMASGLADHIHLWSSYRKATTFPKAGHEVSGPDPGGSLPGTLVGPWIGSCCFTQQSATQGSRVLTGASVQSIFQERLGGRGRAQGCRGGRVG